MGGRIEGLPDGAIECAAPGHEHRTYQPKEHRP